MNSHEYSVEDFGISQKELASLVANNYLKLYTHRNYHGMAIRYQPTEDSEAWRRQSHHGFSVTYSLPENEATLVASFWSDAENEHGEMKRQLTHVDVTKLMELVLLYYENHGHVPAIFGEPVGSARHEEK